MRNFGKRCRWTASPTPSPCWKKDRPAKCFYIPTACRRADAFRRLTLNGKFRLGWAWPYDVRPEGSYATVRVPYVVAARLDASGGNDRICRQRSLPKRLSVNQG